MLKDLSSNLKEIFPEGRFVRIKTTTIKLVMSLMIWQNFIQILSNLPKLLQKQIQKP